MPGLKFLKNFLFVLIAQLIFTRPLRGATSPLLLIWNLVFKVSFGTLSQKHLRHVARGSRSMPRAPHIGVCQGVSGLISVLRTLNSLNYHTLTAWCVRCAQCAGIFKLFETFFKNTVLFFKTNFNLNLPCTPCTPSLNPYSYWLSEISKCAHLCVHPCTPSLEPRTPNREPRFATHLSRSMTHELANHVKYYLAEIFSRNDVKKV